MQVVEAALSALYIPRCTACDAPVARARPLCQPCEITLDPLGPACPRCAAPQSAGHGVECARCRTGDWPLSALVAPWRYGGELGRALRRLKFAHRTDVARALAPLYAPFLRAACTHGEVDVIVPVPLHWRRLASRGFNQAEALARHAKRFAELTTRVDTRALKRARATTPQTQLDGPARRHNVASAFAGRAARVAGKRVLLVDDVVATGATLAAAARALRDAGAVDVLGFAFARADA